MEQFSREKAKKMKYIPENHGGRGSTDSLLWNGIIPGEDRNNSSLSADVIHWLGYTLISDNEDLIDGTGDPNLVDWETTDISGKNPYQKGYFPENIRELTGKNLLEKIFFQLELQKQFLEIFVKSGVTLVELTYQSTPNNNTRKKRKKIAKEELNLLQICLKTINRKRKLEKKLKIANKLFMAMKISEKPSQKRLEALKKIA